MPPDSISPINNPIPPISNPTPPPIQASTPKKPIWKPLSIALICLSVLLIGGGAFLLVQFLNPSNCPEPENSNPDVSDSPDQSSSSPVDASDVLETATTIRQFLTDMKYSIPYQDPETQSPFYTGLISFSDSGAAQFTPEGYSYNVNPSLSFTMTISGSAIGSGSSPIPSPEQAFTGVISYLDSQGFSINDYRPSNGDGTSYIKLARKDSLLCFVDDITITKASVVNVACADMSWYAAEAKKLLPFAEAYKEKMGDWPGFIGAGDLDVKAIDSAVSPYQTASLFGANSYMLFYRVNPTSRWQLFAAGQSGISCDKYNTPDLKNAYKGEKCYLNNGQPSKVGS